MIRLPAFLALLLAASLSYAQSLGFEVKMKYPTFVVGEPVIASVTIENHGVRPVNISDFGPYKGNRLFFEISVSPHTYLPQRREGKIVSDLELERNEGTEFEVRLSDWYDLLKPGVYRIRAVLLVGDERYASALTAFDVVPGIELAAATQYLPGRPPTERSLRLVYWSRNGRDVAFLRAWDSTGAVYGTLEIGTLLRIRKPVLQQADENTFFVYRQVTRDTNQRAEITSDASGVSLKEQLRSLDTNVPIIDELRQAVDEADAARAAKKKKDGKAK